jgi:diguanylate cyclase (GGDEF)-like protein/PAS domain S-box-containing protein
MAPSQRAVWRIVLAYAVFAGLWIWGSDTVVGWWWSDPAELQRISMVKGWLFVALTAVLLYGLVARLVARLQASLNRAHHAADALRESQRQLRHAHEIAGIGQYELDLETQRWQASPLGRQLLGLSQAGPYTLDEWQALVHPEDWPILSDHFGAALSRASHFDRTYRIVRPSDGAVRWIRALGEPRSGHAGGPVRQWVGTFQDITEAKQAERRLQASQQRLQALLDALPDLLFEVGLDGRIHAYHSHRRDLLAAPPEVFLGKSFADVLPPEAAAVCRDAVDEAHSQGVSTGKTYALDLPDGRHWFELSVAPIHDAADETPRFVFISRDVSARHQAQRQLELAGRVFHHAREAIMVTDAQSAILDVNEAFTRITGYTRDEVLGQNPRILSSGRQSPEFYQAMWDTLLRDDAWSGEIWNRRKTGEVYAELLTISVVRDAQGAVLQFVALFSDITAIKKAQARLEYVAHFDALTGLPNRLLLADRLQQALHQAERRGGTVAIAYLDLDGFKAINDTHGHDVGDQLLVAFAHRLHEALRTGDTLARIGGDEFVAVLIDLPDEAAALPLVQRMLHIAAEELHVQDLHLRVSASLGLTYYPQAQPVAPDQLLRQGDLAMYQAKLAGKNRYAVFDAAQESSTLEHQASLQRLRQALTAGEFVLHFQPKVDLHRGVVTGAEALVRWQHPERGLLPPGEFLPQLEGQSLAAELDDWVLGAALTHHAAWRAVGLSLPISVNVGALRLQQPGFVERLREQLAAHPGFDPADLHLEILETSALHDLGQVAALIDACQGLGVRFVLDDFGTGYSSLTYLRQLDVAGLKIDQSFVREMLNNADDLAILKGILGMAHAFQIDVVAEGVETAAHGQQLLALGCPEVQGYGIARPMPADALPDWVRHWQPSPDWRPVPESPTCGAGAGV